MRPSDLALALLLVASLGTSAAIWLGATPGLDAALCLVLPGHQPGTTTLALKALLP